MAMNPLKILIVENEILVAKQLSIYLVKQKYQITGIARAGEHALELIKHETPDIILMDIQLDGELDGIQTATIIHQKLIIPIIYLTQIRDEPTFARARTTLPAMHLTKPFKNHDVRNAIEMTISSFSLLHGNKTKDVSVSPEISIENEEKKPEELFILKDRVFVKNNSCGFDRLILSEVISIKADERFVHILTVNGKLKILYKLSSFLKMLNNYPIVRINRGTAVNANYVYQLSKTEINLEYPNQSNKDGETIKISYPISNTYRNEALTKFRVTLNTTE